MKKNVLWWGNFDPDYSRNRILRNILSGLGWSITDFHPRICACACLEARLRSFPEAFDLVWVPCFRQRDVVQAARWARSHKLPLLFDPLISAYDKQVNERQKFSAEEKQAKRLLAWEIKRFGLADCLLADTEAHADYFQSTLAADGSKTHVVPVGAEENLFFPKEEAGSKIGPLEVLFYGSFISLQGPQFIAEAVSLYKGPPVTWRFIGEGPLLSECQNRLQGKAEVTIDPWMPYTELPDAIRDADIVLGIFGESDKACRVIPNKVYQSLACGKPVITRAAPSYPEELNTDDAGIYWVPPGDPVAIADAVGALAKKPESLLSAGQKGRESYEQFFSEEVVSLRMKAALNSILKS